MQAYGDERLHSTVADVRPGCDTLCVTKIVHPVRALALFVLIAWAAGVGAQRANSPDQRYAVTIITLGAGDENGTGSQAIVLSDRKSGRERRLLVSRWNGITNRTSQTCPIRCSRLMEITFISHRRTLPQIRQWSISLI